MYELNWNKYAKPFPILEISSYFMYLRIIPFGEAGIWGQESIWVFQLDVKVQVMVKLFGNLYPGFHAEVIIPKRLQYLGSTTTD